MPGSDGWSIEDHLGRIRGWDRCLIAVLGRRSPLAAIGIDLAALRLPEDDALNARLVEPARAPSLAEVLGALQRTRGRLLAVVAAVPDGDLERLVVDYQPDELAGGTDSIAGWISLICDEHMREHVGWIRRLNAGG